jgi:hypothetical protein
MEVGVKYGYESALGFCDPMFQFVASSMMNFWCGCTRL